MLPSFTLLDLILASKYVCNVNVIEISFSGPQPPDTPRKNVCVCSYIDVKATQTVTLTGLWILADKFTMSYLSIRLRAGASIWHRTVR